MDNTIFVDDMYRRAIDINARKWDHCANSSMSTPVGSHCYFMF